MNVMNLLNQFLGSNQPSAMQGMPQDLTKLLGGVSGGFAGGAAAGGLVALLAGSKKARKLAGTAAAVGGAALLGSVAYSAYKNWQLNAGRSVGDTYPLVVTEQSFKATALDSEDFQMTLVKAMISAAKADGHIDAEEQKRVFDAVDHMRLTTEGKAIIFDLFREPPSMDALVRGAVSIEQKAEIYLASCLVIDIQSPAESDHLRKLEAALKLPHGLALQLQQQAEQALLQAA